MLLLFILASGFWLLTPAFSQTPSLTTVKDTVYRSDGTPASGTVVITWPAFVTGDSRAVFGGTRTLPLTNGALAVALAPNSGATPSGTSYQVKYFQSGGVFFEETWVVPTSSPLINPAQPVSVTQAGTPGSTTYHYWCTATNANGETLLSPSRITTTSNATLSMTNYNIITCATVTSATGYKAYRTATATAPSGTGLYLVGSSATTTINDQSNTLQSATIPALNTTDPRTLSAVRVTAAPSSTVTIAASQVQGNAIVSNPSFTQTITAPPGSGTPLQIKGRSGNTSNVFEVYDNAATPAVTHYWNSSGQECFEGSIVDANDVCFSVTNPTASRTITVPNSDTVLVVGDAGAANQFLTGISATTGVISKAQPSFSNLSGIATAAQGGTGDDTSATTGVPRIASGNWTYDASISHLGTFSSADLAGRLTDETGSGLAVFATTPTFTTNLTAPLVIGGTGTTSTLALRSTSGVGAAGADIIFQVGNSGATEAARILNSGNVGIGTNNPSSLLALSGQATRIFQMERHQTADTAGNSLTILAGGATASATNKAGGALLAQTGLGTGNSVPAVFQVQQDALGTASGTSDHTRVDRLITGASKVLTDGSGIALVSATIANDTSIGGKVSYCVEVVDATPSNQIECGEVSYVARNNGGTVAGNTTVKYGNQQALEAGTLTCTWTITAANPAVLTLNCDTSLTPSAGYPRVTFSIENLTQQAIAVQ